MRASNSRTLLNNLFSTEPAELSFVPKNHASARERGTTQRRNGRINLIVSHARRAFGRHSLQRLRLQRRSAVSSVWHEMWWLRGIQHSTVELICSFTAKRFATHGSVLLGFGPMFIGSISAFFGSTSLLFSFSSTPNWFHKGMHTGDNAIGNAANYTHFIIN